MPDVRFDNACFATDSPVRLSIAASPAQGALISTFDRHISGVKRLRGSSRLVSGFNLPIGFDESVRAFEFAASQPKGSVKVQIDMPD